MLARPKIKARDFKVRVVFGDSPGHDFHGNQYTDGYGTVLNLNKLTKADALSYLRQKHQTDPNLIGDLMKHMPPSGTESVPTGRTATVGRPYWKASDLDAAIQMMKEAGTHKTFSAARFGDLPGHEFHGNQYTQGNYSSLSSMPSHIDGVPIEKRALQSNIIAIGGTSGILVNTSRRVSHAWKDMAAYQKKAYESGWQSSPHPDHVIFHELGHVLSKRDGGAEKDSYRSNVKGAGNTTFENAARQVSRYAGTNGHEYVAEVYAGMRAGRKFGPDVMGMYERLGGQKL